jgi:hypothetical protein
MTYCTILGTDKQIQTCLDDLDEVAVAARVEHLRPKSPFTLKIPKTPDETDELDGGFNLHVQVFFEDDVKWLIRFTRYGKGHGPAKLLENNLESEALTYKLLLENGIPVPAVHDWGVAVLSKTQSESNDVRALGGLIK